MNHQFNEEILKLSIESLAAKIQAFMPGLEDSIEALSALKNKLLELESPDAEAIEIIKKGNKLLNIKVKDYNSLVESVTAIQNKYRQS